MISPEQPQEQPVRAPENSPETCCISVSKLVRAIATELRFSSFIYRLFYGKKGQVKEAVSQMAIVLVVSTGGCFSKVEILEFTELKALAADQRQSITVLYCPALQTLGTEDGIEKPYDPIKFNLAVDGGEEPWLPHA